MREVPVFKFMADPDLESGLRDAASRVLASQRYVLGPEVAAFEEEFAQFCGARECIGVASGTDALELALRAAGIAPGDRVATVANAGYYACAALDAIGAPPLFVDVDETLTMSPTALAAQLPGAKAVVVTHLYGHLADVDAIVAMASALGIPVIEDCAHAHGARRDAKHAGSFGTAGCFSFYPTKNLGALGDAGAVITSDPALAARVRVLRQYGWRDKYQVDHPGGRNSRLDELQAAFLRVKLRRLNAANRARVAIAERYCRGLRGLDVTLPEWHADDYVSHLFVVRVRDRSALRAHLATQRIGTEIHYPIPDHRQPVRALLPQAHLPLTELACREVVTLPCYPGLASADVDRIVESVHAHYRTARVTQ